jgi:hypothetical protein
MRNTESQLRLWRRNKLPDLSFLPLMGAEALVIVGIVFILIVALKLGFPKYLEYRLKIAEIKASASKGVLSEDISAKLKGIENTVANLEENYSKVSMGTLENQLFIEERSPFTRLKAFRRLIAWRRNGRVKDKGMQLVLENKETWRDVLETELGVEIVDQGYYKEIMQEIEKRFFDSGL